jgi:ribosomal peptide maturation radical SAM protein 1
VAKAADLVPSALLLSMPWTDIDTPNLGLGVLKAELENHNVECRVRHLNIEMLRFLKSDTYYAISNIYALNDFLFAGVLDPVVTANQLRWLRLRLNELIRTSNLNLEKLGGKDGLIARLLDLRANTIPAWLAEKADEIALSDATFVGASCMFDQTIASVALLKLVRERTDTKLLALGGYAVRQPTADTIMKAFPWIDAICLQEGENVIVPFVEASAGKRDLSDVPGILFRDGDGGLTTTAPCANRDLDDVPMPVFDDYFADLEDLSDNHAVDIHKGCLPVENSRGCWWGQKNHCVFCGIKETDLVYRFRSAGRALSDLKQLSQKYDHNSFRFSDYILPNDYYRTLLGDLARLPEPFQFDGEIKANVGLNQMRAIAAAGFRSVQPGIESFSSACLRKMSKGVTSVQNVYLLRLGKQVGVTIIYNFLYGFPNDALEDYAHIADEIRWFSHFDLPVTYVPVQITRYSPMQMSPESFGIGALDADDLYKLIFSPSFLERTGFEMNKFCYYFNRAFDNAPRLQHEYQRIANVIHQLRLAQSEQTQSLTWQPDGDAIRVSDRRMRRDLDYTLGPAESRLYRQFEKPNSKARAFAEYRRQTGREDAQALYAELRKKGLLFEDEAMAVGLMVEPECDSGGADGPTLITSDLERTPDLEPAP